MNRDYGAGILIVGPLRCDARFEPSSATRGRRQRSAAIQKEEKKERDKSDPEIVTIALVMASKYFLCKS